MKKFVAPLVAGVSLLAGNAIAAEFAWDGFYAGGAVGAHSYSSDYTYGTGEVFLGLNYLISESILIGVEGSAGAMDNGKDGYGHLFILGRAGFLAIPHVLVYGVAGTGIEWYLPDADLYSEAVYQLGAGVEVAATDYFSVRGQVAGVGYYLDDGDFFDAIRPSVGVAFHF